MRILKDKLGIEDSSTIFVLAGAMISTLHMMSAKDSLGIAILISKVRSILERDPGFLKRFEAEQDKVMAEFNKIMEEENARSTHS